ncbi:MAG TPA: PfkB family carbohydrate kinase [Bryobacteraceae bacterium]|nr:PfkB family carbohydrate kinase [Bryobacteraceae bacterium]
MNVEAILAAFPRLRVLVLGDVCLDRWCTYDPALADPSRETGIPRIAVVSTEVSPGAAGTIASNVAALGARVGVIGLVGRDGFGHELSRALDTRGIASHLLVWSEKVATFTYTKLLNARTGDEDLPRVDFINTRPVPEDLEDELLHRLEEAAPDYDAILVADQAETDSGGVVTPAVREALAGLTELQSRPLIWVDSRLRAEHFRRVIVKPNRREAEAASLRALGSVDFAELRRRMEAPLLVITEGANGARLVDEAGERQVATRAIEHPVDICGAGDSYTAGAALTLKVTGDAVAAARFGNLVASITIMKKGTGTASPEEVLRAADTDSKRPALG